MQDDEAYTLEELMQMEDSKELVRRDGKGYVDFYNLEMDRWMDWYWIREGELKTRRGLIRWIRHLIDKNWVTKEHLKQLIELSFKLVEKD